MSDYFKATKYVLSIAPYIAVIYFILNIISKLLPNLQIFLVQNVTNNLSKHNLRLTISNVLILIALLVVQGVQLSIMQNLRLKIQYKLSSQLYSRLYHVIFKTDLLNLDKADYLLKIEESRLAIDGKILECFTTLCDLAGICMSVVLIFISVINISFIYIIFFLAISIIQNTFIYLNTAEKIKLIKYQNQKQREHDYFNNLLQSYDYIKEIRCYSLNNWFEKKRVGIYDEILNAQLGFSNKWSKLNIFWSAIMFLIEALLFFFLLQQTLTNLLIAQVILVIQNNELFVKVITQAIDLVGLIKQKGVFIASLEYVLNNEEAHMCTEYKSNEKLVEMRNVSFKYKMKNVLNSINFTMNKGEIVAVVGENGSGKSTFIKLIAGLLKPDSGTINLYTNKISVVFQDYSTYKFTFRENVAFGNLNEINNNIKISNTMDYINLDYLRAKLPNGYDTHVGRDLWDDAIDLSGGEWQKIAMARSLYKDAELIILDEPSSSLDPISEITQIQSFMNCYKDKGIILVSHRIGLVNLAHKIIYFRDGKIVEQGNHQELLKLNKEYAKLYKAQAKWYL